MRVILHARPLWNTELKQMDRHSGQCCCCVTTAALIPPSINRMSLHPFATLRSVLSSLQKNPKSTWFWANLSMWLKTLFYWMFSFRFCACHSSLCKITDAGIQGHVMSKNNGLQGLTNPTSALQGEDVNITLTCFLQYILAPDRL